VNFLGDINIAAAAGWRVHPLSMRTMHGATSHHLELTGYLSGGQLFLHIDYDPAVHAVATIAALRAGLLRRLAPVA
jgi:hypothetical protein